MTVDQIPRAVSRSPRRRERPEPVVRSVVRRNTGGEELGDVDLAPSVFGIEPNVDVMHQVVTAQLAARRSGTQSTKTRAEVRGGGAKPYRQKGTGRARQGSLRASQYVGGGIALGPKPRDYRQRTPKKMIRLALCSALSDRAASGHVALVDEWDWQEPRTKSAVDALGALELGGKVLVVLGQDDVVAERSFNNLPDVQCVLAAELSAYDVLKNDWVVFTDESLPGAEPRSIWDGEDEAEEGTAEAVEVTAGDATDEEGTGDAADGPEGAGEDADGQEEAS